MNANVPLYVNKKLFDNMLDMSNPKLIIYHCLSWFPLSLNRQCIGLEWKIIHGLVNRILGEDLCKSELGFEKYLIGRKTYFFINLL